MCLLRYRSGFRAIDGDSRRHAFGLPLAVTEHLDAGTGDQQMQASRRRMRSNRYREMLLSLAHGTEVRLGITSAGRIYSYDVGGHITRQRELDAKLERMQDTYFVKDNGIQRVAMMRWAT